MPLATTSTVPRTRLVRAASTARLPEPCSRLSPLREARVHVLGVLVRVDRDSGRLSVLADPDDLGRPRIRRLEVRGRLPPDRLVGPVVEDVVEEGRRRVVADYAS